MGLSHASVLGLDISLLVVEFLERGGGGVCFFFLIQGRNWECNMDREKKSEKAAKTSFLPCYLFSPTNNSSKRILVEHVRLTKCMLFWPGVTCTQAWKKMNKMNKTKNKTLTNMTNKLAVHQVGGVFTAQAGHVLTVVLLFSFLQSAQLV